MYQLTVWINDDVLEQLDWDLHLLRTEELNRFDQDDTWDWS